MKLLGRIKRFFSRAVESVPYIGQARSTPTPTDESYERRPVENNTFGGSRSTAGLSEGHVYQQGKFVQLDENTFRRHSPKQLLTILRNNHPDVSQAIWNFKIIGNSGYKVKVVKMDGETEHETGQKMIDEFLRKLDYYKSSGFEKSRALDRVIDQMFDSVLLRGAVAMEMVLNEDFTHCLYFTSVDPDTIDFKVEKGRLIPYQDKVKLDIPTFFHEGLDESETDPYGTSPFLSAIRALAFHLEVLDDIKRVIHNQGYGKYDIKIVEEVLLKRMPIPIRNNEKKKQEWLNKQLADIIEQYSKLDPDAAFVHFDSVEVDMVDNAKAMVDPQKIMAVIDTQIQNALKQYSTLMGRRSQGQTEQYAKMEIKIFMKSVQRIRDIIESILSRALTRLLNINGMQGYVQFKFKDAEIRTELEKVNFEQIAITNAATKRDQGWITQDQASEEVTGQKSVGEPDKEMLGKKTEDPKGAPDERQPNDPQSSDNPRNA